MVDMASTKVNRLTEGIRFVLVATNKLQIDMLGDFKMQVQTWIIFKETMQEISYYEKKKEEIKWSNRVI